MRRLPPCATRTDTRLPYTTLFRSSVGATTLRTRHANLKGATLSLRFVGKSGRKARIDVDDRLLARVVRRCQDLPGQHLFGYVDDAGEAHPVTSTDVNEYIHEVMGDRTSTRRNHSH